MRPVVSFLILIFVPVLCHGQSDPQDISPAQLASVTSLPLTQAVQQRETYKPPVKAAFDRQVALAGKDCQAESRMGQQPYNACMGRAEEQADQDFSILYRNLQFLCHNEGELTALQALERAWRGYSESGLKAAQAAWAEGTGAPGFAAQVHLSLLRDHMRALMEIYGLNIGQ